MTAPAMAVPFAGGDPTSVMGRRVLAAVIDSAIGLVIALAVLVPLIHGHSHTLRFTDAAEASQACHDVNRSTFHRISPDDSNGANPTPLGIFDKDAHYCLPVGTTAYRFDGSAIPAIELSFFVFNLIPAILMYVVLQGLVGWTPGKLLTGIRVVREDGSNTGMGWALLRWVLLRVDSACFIGFVVACCSKGHRRIGDMAASTFVVHRAAAGSPIQVPGMEPQPAYGYGPPPNATPGWGAPPPQAGGGGQHQIPVPTAVDGPQWDEARGTYIQFDRSVDAWVQWDVGRNAWKPIDT